MDRRFDIHEVDAPFRLPCPYKPVTKVALSLGGHLNQASIEVSQSLRANGVELVCHSSPIGIQPTTHSHSTALEMKKYHAMMLSPNAFKKRAMRQLVKVALQRKIIDGKRHHSSSDSNG